MYKYAISVFGKLFSGKASSSSSSSSSCAFLFVLIKSTHYSGAAAVQSQLCFNNNELEIILPSSVMINLLE